MLLLWKILLKSSTLWLELHFFTKYVQAVITLCVNIDLIVLDIWDKKKNIFILTTDH